MDIGRQWEDRLRIWAEQFPKHYYPAFGTLDMEYFTTMDHLSFEEAARGSFTPAPAGTRWGRKWEYGWFRTTLTVPEPEEFQVTVSPSHFGVWNEELFQVAMDYLTLWSLVQKLPERSLRAERIIEGLKKFTCIADFELPERSLTESIVRAGAALKPLLACQNGSTAPEFTVFGQSHIDLAWLWSIEETMRKSARTCDNQLALMEEYEDYRYPLREEPDPPVRMGKR